MASGISSRLKKELEKMTTNPSEGISCCLRDNSLNILDAWLVGAKGTPYEGGTFLLEVSIPTKYPFQPPRIIFKTRIYHPNIDEGGRICLNVLKMPPSGAWRCTLTIENTLTSVLALMSAPNPDDPLVPEIAEIYKTNRSQFEKTAKEWTDKFCAPKLLCQVKNKILISRECIDKDKPAKRRSNPSPANPKRMKIQTLSDDSDISD